MLLIYTVRTGSLRLSFPPSLLKANLCSQSKLKAILEVMTHSAQSSYPWASRHASILTDFWKVFKEAEWKPSLFHENKLSLQVRL